MSAAMVSPTASSATAVAPANSATAAPAPSVRVPRPKVPKATKAIAPAANMNCVPRSMTIALRRATRAKAPTAKSAAEATSSWLSPTFIGAGRSHGREDQKLDREEQERCDRQVEDRDQHHAGGESADRPERVPHQDARQRADEHQGQDNIEQDHERRRCDWLRQGADQGHGVRF